MASPVAPRHTLRVHVAAAVVVPACLALTWWQATRAVDGNTLSWAYTFEWPLFAGYAVYMWWRLLHDPGPGTATGPGPGPEVAEPHDVDPRHSAVRSVADAVADGDVDRDEDELAAYNRYLAALNQSGRLKRW